MTAIVYESNTGYTRAYAELLGQETGLPVYSRKEAEHALEPGTSVVYLGWLMADGVQGYKKAEKRYDIRAVCAVGMGAPSEKTAEDVRARNGIAEKLPLFVLQGGFDLNRLRGVYRLMMKLMARTVGAALAKKENPTAEERDMLDMLQNGRDCVCAENLREVAAFVRGGCEQ